MFFSFCVPQKPQPFTAVEHRRSGCGSCQQNGGGVSFAESVKDGVIAGLSAAIVGLILVKALGKK